MKNIILICLVSILLSSCGPDPQNNHLTYQNIIIISDMSSRIDNKPTKDIKEIHKILQFFKEECVKPGEKIGDKSSICFSTFSDKTIATIDNETFNNLGDKQKFVNSTGKYKNSGLNSEIDRFQKKVKKAYANIRNKGLDLISILIDKIEYEPIIKLSTFLTDGIDTTFINYENHIYIFTDGYLEYLNKNANKQFYFGDIEIKNVRQYCNKYKVGILEALERNDKLCLPVYKSNNNQFINIHIMETHERDKNDRLQTYKYPKGQRDNEILEAVWRRWAIGSGFKSLSWDKY